MMRSGRDAELRSELVEHRDLAVAGAHAVDRAHLARVRVVVELGAEDVLGGHDAVERGDHDFARRGGDDIERESVAVDAARRGIRRSDRRPPFRRTRRPASTRCSRRTPRNSGIVPDQVGELAALLHQVAVREARDLVFEAGDA